MSVVSGKAVHLTSVHSRYDVRIFFKECMSLKSHGYDVSLIVADGKGFEIVNGVAIFDVGSARNRYERIVKTSFRILCQALKVNAEIYHLHDPELIPIGLVLQGIGKKVIFDSHEDFPKQVKGKAYLGASNKILSKVFEMLERVVCRYFSAIVAATPFIRQKFLRINKNTVDVNNYPIVGELETDTNFNEKPNEVCYVGGIDEQRGIRELILALEEISSTVRLNLVGNFDDPFFENDMKAKIGWQKVDFWGFQTREGVKKILSRSLVGLVTLRPMANYLDSLPIKMFEYMAAGLPVVASNFPLWQEILRENNCGICVNPLDPKGIARAIDWLINHRKEAEVMGKNGRNAVSEKFKWQNEEIKLLAMYQGINFPKVGRPN